MRDRFKNILANEEYVVRGDTIGREGHTEVSGNVDSTIIDHRNLLTEDQACIETTLDMKNLDSSNDATCSCEQCSKHASSNKIIQRIFG